MTRSMSMFAAFSICPVWFSHLNLRSARFPSRPTPTWQTWQANLCRVSACLRRNSSAPNWSAESATRRRSICIRRRFRHYIPSCSRLNRMMRNVKIVKQNPPGSFMKIHDVSWKMFKVLDRSGNASWPLITMFLSVITRHSDIRLSNIYYQLVMFKWVRGP